MKTLNIEEMQNVQGAGFAEGFCVGIGVVAIVSMFTPAAPAGVTALGVLSGACTGYAAYNIF